jgi:hypothetical protein
MRFFGICQHISGMADIRGVLAAIDPAHTLDDLTLSGHHWVMGRQRDSVPLLDGGNWRRVIGDQQWDLFHATWRDRLDGYDAFVCFYPPVFAYLYRCFDKPIICQLPIRYEYPYHRDAQAWSDFNDYLREGSDHGRIILCANNPYDVAYAECFLERPVRFVPSLCEYTEASWHPQRDEVVYYGKQRIAALDDGPFAHKSMALPRGHGWDDVARCKAIAHFPYNTSTMSIIEQYTMGVPLLFPTLDYAVSLYARGAPLFEQASWARTVGDPPGSVITPPRGFPDGHDPNDYASRDSLRHWLRYADYYDATSMPGVSYFSSLDELRAIADRSPGFFADASARIRSRHGERRRRAIEGWRSMIAAIA